MPSMEHTVLHVWGRLSSINVRKVVWAAREIAEHVQGLAIQRTDAGAGFGIVQTPEFLRLNPNGLVPVLQHGDFCLWESNVIVRYLVQTFAQAGLWPDDLRQRFETEQWMDWQQTTLNPAGRDAFLQWIRTAPAARDMPRLQASVAATEPLFTMLDERLARQPFVVGDRFGAADISLACEVHRWFALPQSRPAWPHLERWFSTLRSRPASQGILDMPLS